MCPGARRLAVPRPAAVLAGPGGRPMAVDRHEVVAVRESWLIEDRWWTGRPLRRHYFELMTAEGANRVVFRDLERTLTDEEANEMRDRVYGAIHQGTPFQWAAASARRTA